jgi:hypothetical protein
LRWLSPANSSNQRRVIAIEKLAFHWSEITYEADGMKKNA